MRPSTILAMTFSGLPDARACSACSARSASSAASGTASLFRYRGCATTTCMATLRATSARLARAAASVAFVRSATTAALRPMLSRTAVCT